MKTKTAALEEEIAELTRDIEALAQRVAKTFGGAQRRVMDDVAEPLREHFAEAEHEVEERIQKRPLASVLVAFVAGIAFSTLLWR